MRIARTALSIVGILLILTGFLWIGQGSGAFPYPASSFMIDQTPWIINGAIAAFAGIAILFGARRFLL